MMPSPCKREDIYHFELGVMGYIKRALGLMGSENVEVKRIKGFDSKDREIYYQRKGI